VASTIYKSSAKTGIDKTLIKKLTIPTALFCGKITLRIVIPKLNKLNKNIIEVTYYRAT